MPDTKPIDDDPLAGELVIISQWLKTATPQQCASYVKTMKKLGYNVALPSNEHHNASTQ